MSFIEGWSFLISRRIGSGRAFLPSNKLAKLRTVPRCWDERFYQLVLMPIALDALKRMLKLLFCRAANLYARLPTPLFLLQMLLMSPLL
jgi:hypothetical protein